MSQKLTYTISELIYNDIHFDDYVQEKHVWAPICQQCVDFYSIDQNLLDNCCPSSFCGVTGCENESDYHIDFPIDELLFL